AAAPGFQGGDSPCRPGQPVRAAEGAVRPCLFAGHPLPPEESVLRAGDYRAQVALLPVEHADRTIRRRCRTGDGERAAGLPAVAGRVQQRRDQFLDLFLRRPAPARGPLWLAGPGTTASW